MCGYYWARSGWNEDHISLAISTAANNSLSPKVEGLSKGENRPKVTVASANPKVDDIHRVLIWASRLAALAGWT